MGLSAFARHYSRSLILSSGYSDVSLRPVPYAFALIWYDPDWVSPFGHLWLITAAHASPELFAVYHVLLRHCAPRHSPFALNCFLKIPCDTKKTVFSSLSFSETDLFVSICVLLHHNIQLLICSHRENVLLVFPQPHPRVSLSDALVGRHASFPALWLMAQKKPCAARRANTPTGELPLLSANASFAASIPNDAS